MPKAEVGSAKHLANKMKAKGLQRLRWYCQVCQKQCRDENGFKQHTLSEGHVRQMMLVGQDARKYINDYSNQFKRAFLSLLKSSHGEKKVYINHFYQEYIRDKEHVHMNATRWPSLTEFAKYLGRESICRVSEGERGIEIQWIDDSPEAVQRREDVRRKDRQAKGEEDQESRLLAEQIRRARALQPTQPESQPVPLSTEPEQDTGPIKISLGFGSKAPDKVSASQADETNVEQQIDSFSSTDKPAPIDPPQPVKISFNALAGKTKMNPLMGRNPLAKKPSAQASQPEKKMSNAERIMREEIARKRRYDDAPHGDSNKRFKFG